MFFSYQPGNGGGQSVDLLDQTWFDGAEQPAWTRKGNLLSVGALAFMGVFCKFRDLKLSVSNLTHSLAQQDAVLQPAAEVLVSKALPRYSLGTEDRKRQM